SEGRVKLSRQNLLQLRERQPSRSQVQKRIFCGFDYRSDSCMAVTENFEHRRGNFTGIVKSDGRIGLWIEIDKQRAFAAIGECSGQIDCCCCFPDATFLIRNRDDGSHRFLPPIACPAESRRWRAQSGPCEAATGLLYMGATSRKPPRARLTVRFRSSIGKEK